MTIENKKTIKGIGIAFPSQSELEKACEILNRENLLFEIIGLGCIVVPNNAEERLAECGLNYHYVKTSDFSWMSAEEKEKYGTKADKLEKDYVAINGGS